MGPIATNHPLSYDQKGVWDGEYVYFDANHNIIDRHKSRLICRYDDEGPRPKIRQSNIYTWADGTQEVRYFEGWLGGDRIWFDNDLIRGWTADIKLDPTGRSIMVSWVRKDALDIQFYELINTSPDGERKNRAWQWYRDGHLFQRTLINETRTSRDTAPYDDVKYQKTRPRGPIV